MAIGYNPNAKGNGSWRTTKLPDDWNTLRAAVLIRDNHMCQNPRHGGKKCPNKATEVDHIKRGDDHSLSNLQAICRICHGRKTQAEGQQQKLDNVLRPKEKHPFSK